MKKITFLTLFLALQITVNAQTIIPGGNIETNTTWGISGSPYLIENDVNVLANVTLTIQAGVIVKFYDYYDGINVYGKLDAIGTENDSIVFTALADDAHGGDSNGDGTATAPAPNQWSTVQYYAGSSGSLKYCFVGYGGGEGSANIHLWDSGVDIEHNTIIKSEERGIYVDNSSPDINNNVIKDNLTEGIYINSLDTLKTLSMSNNVFTDNRWAVYLWLSDETADISLIDNVSTGAEVNGVGRNGFGLRGSISGDNTYTGQSDFPFIIADADLTVNTDASLTIISGTTVKFEDYYDGINVYGKLDAIGTENDSIVFTALADDAHGGDSNGDGTATAPAPNQWSTVQYFAGSSGSLKYCFVGYGGGEGSANIHVWDSDVEIEHTTIMGSEERGIYVDNSSPDINNNVIEDNLTEGVYIYGLDTLKTLSMSNNVFTDNRWAVYSWLSDETADISLIDNVSTGAEVNGVGRNGFGLRGSISGDNTYTGQSDFPFIIADADLTVNEDASLSISSGTTIKFEDYWDGINVYGKLDAIGTENDSIVFTALADDAHGGDSNGDGTATAPAPNQWSTVQYYAGSSGSLKYCFVGYGGGEGSANIHVWDSDVEIEHTTIMGSEERGIYVDNSSPDINNNVIEDNLTEGVYIYGLDTLKTLSMSNNVFTDNRWAVYSWLSDETADISLIDNVSTGAEVNGVGRNGFGLRGSISGDNTYTGQSDFPFIIADADLTVNEDASLSISSGTTIKFEDYWDGINVYGKLDAIGTENDSIVFTALADDAHGGDSNGDGTATAPAPNQWSTVQYYAGSSGSLKYCFVGYGGGEGSANIHVWDSDVEIEHTTIMGSEERGIYVDNSSPDINNNAIKDNLTEGVYINSLDSLKTLSMSNNVFSDNQRAVYSILSDETADISLIDNVSTGSDVNGFGRNGFGLRGSISGDNTYTGQSDFPFIIADADLTVNTDASLTISSGTTIKFEDYWDGINVYGSLVADGTENDSISFTALADDAHGGDSNGDGTTTAPAPNQWSTVQYFAGSSGSLKYCFIGYGGGEGSANIHVWDKDVNIEHNTIMSSQERGIYVDNASPDINNNVIKDNLTEGIYTASGALPILSNNDIYDNVNYGLYNSDASVVVDARNNWWGNASGPYHATSNPDGTGNKVSDYVLFSPWLESSVDVNTAIEEVPENTVIKGIYPNPLGSASILFYQVKDEGKVHISVYDLFGKEVVSLVDAYLFEGEYSVKIDADLLAHGIYIVAYKNSSGTYTQKIIKQ